MLEGAVTGARRAEVLGVDLGFRRLFPLWVLFLICCSSGYPIQVDSSVGFRRLWAAWRAIEFMFFANVRGFGSQC